MSNKIIKSKGRKADELELQVAAALQDLETNVADLKADLRPLHITAAKEVSFHFSKIPFYFILFHLILLLVFPMGGCSLFESPCALRQDL